MRHIYGPVCMPLPGTGSGPASNRPFALHSSNNTAPKQPTCHVQKAVRSQVCPKACIFYCIHNVTRPCWSRGFIADCSLISQQTNRDGMHARKLLQQAVQCNGSKMQYLWALVSIKQRIDSDAQGSGLTC